jgi:UDP-N-acetyl-D-mannosaminuronic acid dehydrogenase
MNKLQNKINNVCVIGLGYVGLTLAVKLAEKNFNVIGIEKNIGILNKIKKGLSHFYEPEINKLIKKIIKKKKFKVFNKVNKNMLSDVYIITVGTPLDHKGKFRIDYIKKVCNELRPIIKNNDTIILRSTVKVGTTRNIVLKNFSQVGKKINVAYCPERTQEGKALEELEKLPQIISGANNKALHVSRTLFSSITKKIIKLSSIEAAELLKIIDNTYRDSSFALANEIALVASSLGLSANEIIAAGKKNYKRTNIPLPGPVGGPCLAKDTYILGESLNKSNFKPKISFESRKLNEKLPQLIMKKIYSKLKNKNNNLKISILGFAFKGDPETSDLRGSISIPFVKLLKSTFKNCKIFGYDPVISNKELSFNFSERIIFTKNIRKIFKKSDLVLILNNHKSFKKINIYKLSKNMKQDGIIYDCWSLFKKNKKRINNCGIVEYIPFGD